MSVGAIIAQKNTFVNTFGYKKILLSKNKIWGCANRFVEEFIFRGVLQHAAVEAFRWWVIVYVALFFGGVVKQTGSLFGVTLPHGITNIMLFLVLPFFV